MPAVKELVAGIPRYRHFINGQWADSTGKELIEVENPTTQEIIATVPSESRSFLARLRTKPVRYPSGLACPSPKPRRIKHKFRSGGGLPDLAKQPVVTRRMLRLPFTFPAFVNQIFTSPAPSFA